MSQPAGSWCKAARPAQKPLILHECGKSFGQWSKRNSFQANITGAAPTPAPGMREELHAGLAPGAAPAHAHRREALPVLPTGKCFSWSSNLSAAPAHAHGRSPKCTECEGLHRRAPTSLKTPATLAHGRPYKVRPVPAGLLPQLGPHQHQATHRARSPTRIA